MKLALDHHYSPVIAERLRERALDVIAAAEVGWEAEDDETLLALCAAQQRVLMTNNVGDFAVVARRWQAEGCPHHGLVFTSDHSLPRTRDTIGRFVDALGNLMHASPGDEGFVDRIHWL